MQKEQMRPIVIRKRGKRCWWVCQGRKVLAFAGSFEWAMTRRDMIRDGVLDVPAMEPALKLVS